MISIFTLITPYLGGISLKSIDVLNNDRELGVVTYLEAHINSSGNLNMSSWQNYISNI